MKKALCVLNAFTMTSGPEHFFSRMKEELIRFGYDLEKKTNAEILASIDSEGRLENSLGDYAFVLYLDKDLYLSNALRALGYRMFNSAHSIRLCDDKMLTHLFLANHGIPMPRTISAPLNYSKHPDPSFIERVAESFSFPLVAKENFGSLGKNVFLIRSKEELVSFESERFSSPHLYQEFIASSFGFDYRVIVIGGKAEAWMRRVNRSGDFRSNIAQHGEGELVDLPKSYKALAEKAASILKLDYCGIDLLSGENKEPILCEVNSNAFLKGIEAVTGKNVAAIYAAYIAEKLKTAL